MNLVTKLHDMQPVIVEHNDLKLIGIPCISLNQMGSKYQNAKEGLLSSTKYLPQVINPSIHYGVCPQVSSQNNPETHAYVLCVEVESFEGIPEWYLRITLSKQKCVVVANNNGDFDLAGEEIDRYINDNNLKIDSEGRKYTIGERYNYNGEGFSRYSLPII